MADIDATKFSEPEVAAQVIKEIKTLGDNQKANYTELRKNYEDLKATLDAKGGTDQEKLAKLAEDISVRQESLDKKNIEIEKAMHDRMDNIEVMMKRLPKGEGDVVEIKEAYDFALACAVLSSRKETGVSFEDAQKIKADVDSFRSYKKAYEKYLRRTGGNQNLMMTPEESKALMVGVDSDGGYTVTPAMASQIIKRIYESDPVRQLASGETITTGSLEWLVDWEDMNSG